MNEIYLRRPWKLLPIFCLVLVGILLGGELSYSIPLQLFCDISLAQLQTDNNDDTDNTLVYRISIIVFKIRFSGIRSLGLTVI